jgi:hypothetical protein
MFNWSTDRRKAAGHPRRFEWAVPFQIDRWTKLCNSLATNKCNNVAASSIFLSSPWCKLVYASINLWSAYSVYIVWSWLSLQFFHDYFARAMMMLMRSQEETRQLPNALLACYYVFNMTCPDSLKQFYILLESCLLGNSSERLTMAAKSLFTSLNHK